MDDMYSYTFNYIIMIVSHTTIGLYIAGTYTSITTLGFIYNAILTLLGRKTKGGFNGKVWWNELRILHILLWGTCSVLCFMGFRQGSYLLLVDVILAIIAGLLHFMARSPLSTDA